MDKFDKFFIYSNPLWWVVLLLMFLYYLGELIFKSIKQLWFLTFKIDFIDEEHTDYILRLYHNRHKTGVYKSSNWFARWTWDRGLAICIKYKLQPK